MPNKTVELNALHFMISRCSAHQQKAQFVRSRQQDAGQQTAREAIVQAHPPRLKGSQEHALRDELDVVKVNRPAEVAERKPVWRNKTGAD